MGLDALDLMFRLEKRFGIKISQAERFAVLFDTAGTIHRYLIAKLHGEYQEVPHVAKCRAAEQACVSGALIAVRNHK